MNFGDIDSYSINAIRFVLILIRIGGTFFLAPVFGSKSVPVRIRVWTALFVSIAIFPAVPASSGVMENITVPLFVLYALKELTVGAILGFLSIMPFMATRVGAEIAGRMSGFGMGRVINPDVDENVSLLSQMVYIFVVLMFLSFNGHHIILKILARSFDYIPLGQNVFSLKMTSVVTHLFAFIFNKGITYGAPVLGLLLVISASMGIVGKTVPQMNIMMMVLPIRVFAGVSGIILTLPILMIIIKKLILLTEKSSDAIILLMSKGTG